MTELRSRVAAASVAALLLASPLAQARQLTADFDVRISLRDGATCGLQRAGVEALRYAETLSDDVRAIYVDVNPAQTEQLQREWATWGGRVELVVLPSPFRSLMEPLLEYIEQAAAEKSSDYVTVILPEFVPKRWWQHLFHNQTSLLIKGALLFRPNIVVTSVPFHLSK